MKISRLSFALLVAACTFITCSWVGPAEGAVKMGYHMDFVLSNGTSVRVFPQAEEKGRFVQPITRPDPKVNTKPIGGDPCEALKKKFDEKTGKRKARVNVKGTGKLPPWVKKIPALTNYYAASASVVKEKPTAWYYLPATPRLSFRDGKPEATLVKFMTDEETGKNSAEGGIFHLLATYGLTMEEEAELSVLLGEAVPGALLKGMVDLEPARSGDNFIVTSGTLSDEGFAPKGVLTSGRAPSQPGGKVAMAGRLSAIGAQLLATTFENPTSDFSVTFVYDYIAKTPAYNAQVVIDLDKVRETAECSLKSQDSRRVLSASDRFHNTLRSISPIHSIFTKKRRGRLTVSRQQLEEAYDTLIMLGAVDIQIDQNLPDADVTALESGLMDMAMNSFLEMQRSFATPEEAKASDLDLKDNAKAKDPSGQNWAVYKVKRKREKMSGRLTMNISKSMAIYRTHTMTGNMGAELRNYSDDVFSEVTLNDPFFKRGLITVDLDFDALELFENKMVNNASVEVIVPFKGQAPYKNNDIFTHKDVQDGKVISKFTFATRGVDTSNHSCPFKYVESWSLRGGGKWPRNPRPQCSKEFKVTLTPPIEARGIEVEADLGEMEATGIRAADVLLRHKRYGKEKIERVKFRVANPNPYVEKTLFVDKSGEGKPETLVEYRVVFVHKVKGQLPPSPWRKLEGNFVYASITGLPESNLDAIKALVPAIEEFLGE